MRIPYPSRLVILLVASTGCFAQQTYHAPKGQDGHPNLNGIWQAINTANWDLQEHAARPGLVIADGTLSADPGGTGVVEGGVIPYLPAALETKKKNFESRLEARPGDSLLSAGCAAGQLYAVSVSDLPKCEGSVLRVSI